MKMDKIIEVDGGISYQCALCNAVFVFKGSLAMHLRMVHMQRSVKCEVCKVDYTIETIDKHKKKQHQEKMAKKNKRKPKRKKNGR